MGLFLRRTRSLWSVTVSQDRPWWWEWRGRCDGTEVGTSGDRTQSLVAENRSGWTTGSSYTLSRIFTFGRVQGGKSCRNGLDGTDVEVVVESGRMVGSGRPKGIR